MRDSEESREMFEMETENNMVSEETMKYILERAENIKRYSDKLSEAIRKIDLYFDKIGSISGIGFLDSEIIFTDHHNYFGKLEYRLGVSKYNDGWGLVVAQICPSDDVMDKKLLAMEVKRPLKKEIIKRLPEFMRLYSEELKKYEKEYEEISEIAAKFAEVLRDE